MEEIYLTEKMCRSVGREMEKAACVRWKEDSFGESPLRRKRGLWRRDGGMMMVGTFRSGSRWGFRLDEAGQSGPSRWYEAELCCDDFKIGYVVIGIPSPQRLLASLRWSLWIQCFTLEVEVLCHLLSWDWCNNRAGVFDVTLSCTKGPYQKATIEIIAGIQKTWSSTSGIIHNFHQLRWTSWTT